MRKPLIILTNDDGIKSDGLKVLYEAVEGLGDILIAAPDRQRSGASHALSVIDEIRVKRLAFKDAEAYSVSGTPVDCAKLALLKLAKRKPSLVLSGINHGPNIAQFILYSGTIGAAAEAAVLGIPAVAFSIDSYVPEEWEYGRGFVRKFVSALLGKKIPLKRHSLINVNLPHLKPCGIRGIKVLPRGGVLYGEKYDMVSAKGGASKYRHIITDKKKSKKNRFDADGVENGYVTVTGLNFDLNDISFMRKLSKSRGLRVC
ncbi:MAG TPA: 5'/3'-nucleotidase SurE [Candidatus Goldiibacteriota bacterium]|nr:5'/3'-nucleotidase SurE [Candidatus Goldiibacteriota bacterium]